jgi:hypothetical protein
MRIMTGKAESALEGRMINISACLKAGLVVALITEFSSAQLRIERFGGCSRIVAHITAHRNYRVMGACFEELGLDRGMRIMALCAGLCLNRILSVCLPEGRLVAGMTRHAEWGRCIFQKIWFVRTV